MRAYMVWFKGRKPDRVSLVPPELLDQPISKVKAVTGATVVVVASSFGEAIAEAGRQMNYQGDKKGDKL